MIIRSKVSLYFKEFLILQEKTTMFITVLSITLVLLAVAFAAIGVKMFVKKGGRFERRCENEGSLYCHCGGKGGANCQNCPNKAIH